MGVHFYWRHGFIGIFWNVHHFWQEMKVPMYLRTYLYWHHTFIGIFAWYGTLHAHKSTVYLRVVIASVLGD
jgi:hypothetical protein